MRVPSNFVVNPVNINNAYNEQDDVREKANRWKGVNSTNLIKKDNLKELTDQKHQVKVTENFNQDECIVDCMHATFVLMLQVRDLFK